MPGFLAAADVADGKLELLGPEPIQSHQDYYLCIKVSRRNEEPLKSLAQWFRSQVQPNKAAHI